MSAGRRSSHCSACSKDTTRGIVTKRWLRDTLQNTLLGLSTCEGASEDRDELNIQKLRVATQQALSVSLDDHLPRVIPVGVLHHLVVPFGIVLEEEVYEYHFIFSMMRESRLA